MPSTRQRTGLTSFTPPRPGAPAGRPAAAPAGAPGAAAADARVPRRALLVLGAGLLVLLHQAFVPLAEFVHRGDDAYYYFQLAANYPHLGFWSFDGTQPTNGVQPLWAILLTVVAQLAAWAGVTDVRVLDRVFVAVAALAQFAAAVVLYRLLAARVSVGTGLAAAGACLFPMGLVWGRLWGMESALLALMLTATVAYHALAFRPRPTARGAAVLGLLLGLTCLSRLNAGLLIPVLLLAHLGSRGAGPFAARLRHVLVAGAVATAVVLPYLALNLAQTGHLLPISGQVKAIGVERTLAEWEVPGRLSRRFVSEVNEHWRTQVDWFLTSRLLDGMWMAGVRAVHDAAAAWRWVLALLAALVAGPLLLGRPAEWLRFLGGRLRALAPFWWFAAYAVLDAVVAVVVYPTQTYAIPRWWLVGDEILLVVLAATLTAAAVEYVGARLVPAPRRAALAAAALTALVAAHAWQAATFYWNGRMDYRDWNLSWNDESYRAATWIDANVPEGALVGSWNAGVVGYYSERPVVNLDGLINNAALLPYLRADDVAAYILARDIRYLSDMDGVLRRTLHGRLALTEVYRHHSAFMNADYRIVRVDGPARAAGGEAGR